MTKKPAKLSPDEVAEADFVMLSQMAAFRDCNTLESVARFVAVSALQIGYQKNQQSANKKTEKYFRELHAADLKAPKNPTPRRKPRTDRKS